MKTYEEIQQEESKTWLLEDPKIFADKKQREVVRYPLLAKQMGLNVLDTSNMEIVDVGAGPFLGVSSVLNAKNVLRVDPLKEDYGKIADVTSYDSTQAEQFDYQNADLVIATNCIDHFEYPHKFMMQLIETMKSGAYFAHFHAIDNAVTHPHPAHVHNINPEWLRSYLKDDFEEVWYMDYQNDGITYAWRKQPAFCGLYRKVTGYNAIRSESDVVSEEKHE
jgi:hypothetical protein